MFHQRDLLAMMLVLNENLAENVLDMEGNKRLGVRVNVSCRAWMNCSEEEWDIGGAYPAMTRTREQEVSEAYQSPPCCYYRAAMDLIALSLRET